jgi:hypothetical protein
MIPVNHWRTLSLLLVQVQRLGKAARAVDASHGVCGGTEQAIFDERAEALQAELDRSLVTLTCEGLVAGLRPSHLPKGPRTTADRAAGRWPGRTGGDGTQHGRLASRRRRLTGIVDCLNEPDGRAEPTWVVKRAVTRDRWRPPVDPALS